MDKFNAYAVESKEERTARLEAELRQRRIAEANGPTGGDMGLTARLFAKVISKDNSRVNDLGLVSTEKVGTSGVNWLAACFYGASPSTPGDLKYHQMGTDATAETNTQTALLAPITTGRDAGTMTVGASANIFKSVATLTNVSSATVAIVEHGIFFTASGNALFDRSQFAAVNLAPADKIEFTYNLTFSAEAAS